MPTLLHRFRSVVFFLVGFCSFISAVAESTSTAVSTGQTFSLSVTADGTAPFSYQWFRDGVVLAGVTGSTYSRSGAQLTDAGVYHAVVSNAMGSTSSASVSLLVSVSPAFTQQPAGQTVAAGASVTFTAAASGSPVPVFQWLKNGVNLVGATSASYSIASAASGDAGIYSVVASNSAGAATSAGATLIVSAPAVAPVITAQPLSQTATTGTKVTFTAAASGSPAPVYQWRKDGVALSGATGSSYSVTGVTSSSAGTYSVTASNASGTATSTGAVLTVNSATSAPVFTTQPISKTVKIGVSVTFIALASGTPAPTYQWRKNGAAIAGATTNSYTISSASNGSAGTYTVVATNSAGSATSTSAILTIDTGVALARADFNGDGKTDILWQNIATRQAVVWYMNGTVQMKGVSLGFFPQNWKVSGAGDFDNDGKPDILCQNVLTGEFSIWLVSGMTVTTKISLGSHTLDWQISGIGDFNGDRRPDIVLQSHKTGEILVWLMAGTNRASVVSLGTQALEWQVTGSGDFNGDGKSDLIWQNTVTGAFNLWLMSGTTVTWKAWIATVSTAWQISGSGDFSGDGKSDILCQNVLTGECSLWLMSSNVVSQKISLGTQHVDWVIRN